MTLRRAKRPWDRSSLQNCGNAAAHCLRSGWSIGHAVLHRTAGDSRHLWRSTHRKSSSVQHHPSSKLPPAAQNVCQDIIGAAPDFLPEENRFVGNGFFNSENIRDVPHALHLAQQQVHAVFVADLLTAFVQFRTCGFVRRQVSNQFIAENKSPEEPRAQTAIEPEKLPPAGAGEVRLRCFRMPRSLLVNIKMTSHSILKRQRTA